jgi:hypothetical protein
MVLRSISTRVLAAAVLFGIAGCAPAPSLPVPLTTGGPESSLVAARKYLEGRWSLQSFEVHSPQRPVVALQGSGTLSYDAFGNLTMDIRTDVATSDQLRAAGIVIQDGVISSKGRTAVDMQNRTLTYVIEGQPVAGTGPLATSRPRHWQVDGDVLTLTTKDDAGAVMSVSKWKKAPS